MSAEMLKKIKSRETSTKPFLTEVKLESLSGMQKLIKFEANFDEEILRII